MSSNICYLCLDPATTIYKNTACICRVTLCNECNNNLKNLNYYCIICRKQSKKKNDINNNNILTNFDYAIMFLFSININFILKMLLILFVSMIGIICLCIVLLYEFITTNYKMYWNNKLVFNIVNCSLVVILKYIYA